MPGAQLNLVKQMEGKEYNHSKINHSLIIMIAYLKRVVVG